MTTATICLSVSEEARMPTLMNDPPSSMIAAHAESTRAQFKSP